VKSSNAPRKLPRPSRAVTSNTSADLQTTHLGSHRVEDPTDYLSTALRLRVKPRKDNQAMLKLEAPKRTRLKPTRPATSKRFAPYST